MTAPTTARVRAQDVRPGQVMTVSPYVAQRGGLVTFAEHRSGVVHLVVLDCPGFVLENPLVTEVELTRDPDDVVHVFVAEPVQ